METDRRLTFGNFCLDPTTQQLCCGEEVVALTPKAFAVLRRLVEAAGPLVSKGDLLRAGWAKSHVSDGVLKVIILEIRRALGDDPAAPSFIETVPRRGYRFIARRTHPARVPVVTHPRDALVGRDRPVGLFEPFAESLVQAQATRRGVSVSQDAWIRPWVKR